MEKVELDNGRIVLYCGDAIARKRIEAEIANRDGRGPLIDASLLGTGQ